MLFLACKGPSQDRPPPPAPSTSASTSTASPTAPSTPTATTTPTATPAPDADISPATSFAADASPPRCRVIRGPIELPLRGPASLSARGDTVDVVLNEGGRPRTLSFPAGVISVSASVAREAAAGTVPKGFSIPCATAGEWVFCNDPSGGVHRTNRAGAEDHVVASARSTSRIAAAMFAGGHTAIGYLASRQTSEGWVSEAWIVVDDAPPRRLSEDGSGATALALAPRGHALTAVMIDARSALTAMHARTVTYDNAVRLGEDAVVFVGGPGDRRTGGALVVPPAGPAWSLMPIAKDVETFGLAIVRLDDPPHVDEPVVWAEYPNGLDPAPIAAASGGGRSPVTWVARVRPRAAEPGALRVLELGQITLDGAFAPRDIVAAAGNATDVALVIDALGAPWVAWVDAAGGWLERLSCR
jgi:hypothetical protein